MATKLTYVLKITTPEDALADDGIHLIQGLSQDLQDRLPEAWKAKLKLQNVKVRSRVRTSDSTKKSLPLY